MTIFFPDLSHYDLNRGVAIEPNTVAVIVKGTHGQFFVDSAYDTYKQQAADRGTYFTAYHWLNHADPKGQAAYCWQQLGRVPVMIDAEDMPGDTGFTGPLAVQDLVDFATELRRLGGICHLAYVPRWYWQNNMGSPDLTPLSRAGLGVVSSNYSTYSDTGPGWNGYGGIDVVQWQYTDKLPYGGDFTDFNAYLGTLDQYKQLTQGEPMSQDFAQLPRPIPNTPDWMTGDIAAVDAATVLRRRMTAWQTGQPGATQGDDAASWWIVQQVEATRRDTKAALVQASTNGASLTSIAQTLAGLAAPAAPTQDQVNAAMLKAMQDPGVQAGIAAALAAHLHVS